MYQIIKNLDCFCYNSITIHPSRAIQAIKQCFKSCQRIDTSLKCHETASGMQQIALCVDIQRPTTPKSKVCSIYYQFQIKSEWIYHQTLWSTCHSGINKTKSFSTYQWWQIGSQNKRYTSHQKASARKNLLRS